jgi:hypothetical protein
MKITEIFNAYINESFNEPTGDQAKFLGKIREKQAESGKYTDASMERSYKKLIKLSIDKLEELSQLNVMALKQKGY